MPSLRQRWRATGADFPGPPSDGAHGVPMEGWFWRIVDPAAGRVVLVMGGLCRGADGRPWSFVGVALEPERRFRWAVAPGGSASPTDMQVDLAGLLTLRDRRLRVHLDDLTLDATLDGSRPWPSSNRFGALGVAHLLPGLSQYWHPHALGESARGTLVAGDRTVPLDGARVYAERNWGGGFPGRWWWGQAHLFPADDACVAFAGGTVRLPLAGLLATAAVVRVDDRVLRVSDMVSHPDPERLAGGVWHLTLRGPRLRITIDGEADPQSLMALPVPVPHLGGLVAGAHQHLDGSMRVTVRRGRRLLWQGTSAFAGLELGACVPGAQTGGWDATGPGGTLPA